MTHITAAGEISTYVIRIEDKVAHRQRTIPMIQRSFPFRLGDVITGEPRLDCSHWLPTGQHLSRLEQEPQEFRLRTSVAMHLPRMILIASGAAGILLWLVGLAGDGPN